jgi:hypothetical protein
MSKEQTYHWVKIKMCKNEIDAQLIKNMLERKNIPVRLFNTNNPYPGAIDIEISVPEELAEKAVKLIKENFN